MSREVAFPAQKIHAATCYPVRDLAGNSMGCSFLGFDPYQQKVRGQIGIAAIAQCDLHA